MFQEATSCATVSFHKAVLLSQPQRLQRGIISLDELTYEDTVQNGTTSEVFEVVRKDGIGLRQLLKFENLEFP